MPIISCGTIIDGVNIMMFLKSEVKGNPLFHIIINDEWD